MIYNKERSGALDLHDKDDMKHHCVVKICNKVTKPIGNADPVSTLPHNVRCANQCLWEGTQRKQIILEVGVAMMMRTI